MLKVLCAMLTVVFFSTIANAGWFSEDTRIGAITPYHSSVDTTTAAAIPAANVKANLYQFQVCNDAINTSTYLMLGEAADVATDGIRLAPGACFVCENCKSTVLEALKVKGQAATNGYSIFQFSK